MEELKILISGKINFKNYINAVENLGAKATAEYLPDIDTSFDGLILAGGGDIDPMRFSEENNGSKNIDTARDEAEFALLKAYVDAGKPVLGICRGHQVINVFFGGSLYQDMPEAVFHKSNESGDNVHTVTAKKGSILEKYYDEEFAVNSSHHQAVKKVGKGLVATALWENKYIEASEHETLPIFSVQFHPERMAFANKREDTVDGSHIINHFIQMCKK